MYFTSYVDNATIYYFFDVQVKVVSLIKNTNSIVLFLSFKIHATSLSLYPVISRLCEDE
jgi:O-antigen/teichoic acid export membrane protein